MAWVLRVTNTVPFANRIAYESFIDRSLGTTQTRPLAYPEEETKKSEAEGTLTDDDRQKLSRFRPPRAGAEPARDAPPLEHIGSYRVAIGNVMEYMHLLRLSGLRVLEQPMEACEVLIKMYDFKGRNLVTDSRYELLKEV